MLFKKRLSVHDFASRLIQLHAAMFGRAALLAQTGQLGISLEGQRLANATSEWLFFGTYTVRQCLATQCGKDVALRDAILDEFFDQLYAGLRLAGVNESEFPHIEDCIKARFLKYDRAQLESRRDPLYSLGLAASILMFGESVDAAKFAMLPSLAFADSIEPIKNLFKGCKIVL